jgi:hypothetical protein
MLSNVVKATTGCSVILNKSHNPVLDKLHEYSSPGNKLPLAMEMNSPRALKNSRIISTYK